jgi:thioredoxin reductase
MFMGHDAIVIGGSFAGLPAAMYIARARRSVAIVDTGLPRNRFAARSHGFFAQDGSAPGDMLATARTQVAAYPTTTFIDGKAVGAATESDGFSVRLATGEVLEAARLVLAFGLSDELPTISGLVERWGRSVIHCPYCHGYEFGGERLGVLSLSPMSVHQAMLIAEWGPTTLYLNGNAAPDDAALAELERRGVAVEPAPVRALHGEGDGLSAIEFADGRTAAIDALYIGPRLHLNSDIGEQLGCEHDDMPLGKIIRTDGFKMTTVSGVFAAGDITRGAHSVTWASADGVTAGTALHRSLVF